MQPTLHVTPRYQSHQTSHHCQIYAWPHINHDVGQWTRACLSCQRSKVNEYTSTPLSTFAPPSARFGGPSRTTASLQWLHLLIDWRSLSPARYYSRDSGSNIPVWTLERSHGGTWHPMPQNQFLPPRVYNRRKSIQLRISHTSTVYRHARGVDEVGQAITPPICVVGVSSHFNFSPHFNLSIHCNLRFLNNVILTSGVGVGGIARSFYSSFKNLVVQYR